MIGEIFVFTGGKAFYPAEILPCDGRELSISEYPELFNAIGSAYGGDGVEVFCLPLLAPIQEDAQEYAIVAYTQ